MYGCPDRIQRHRTFQLLRRISPPNGDPWMCMGDYKEIFLSWEKLGEDYKQTWGMEKFWETATTLGLQDLGFSGNDFTWSNGIAGDANIFVRLDRVLGNPSWRLLFGGSRVLHLPQLNSDHSPIQIFCDRTVNQIGIRGHRKKLFCFEKIWLGDIKCASVMELGWEQNNPLLSLTERTKNVVQD
ncbi:hypothetical protein ACS0TY_032302 [Phlomoides rotata]